MSRPRTLDIESRERSILDAAHAVLIEKGYRDVRLEDVAKRANVAKGTLYLYFRDKETLCSLVMKDVVARLQQRFEGLPKAKRHIETLRAVVQMEMEFISENRDFLAQFAWQRPTGAGSSATKELKKWFGFHLESIGKLLERCAKEGSLRKHDTRQGALCLIGLARMFALKEIPSNPTKPLAVLSDELMDFYLNGVGNKNER